MLEREVHERMLSHIDVYARYIADKLGLRGLKFLHDEYLLVDGDGYGNITHKRVDFAFIDYDDNLVLLELKHPKAVPADLPQILKYHELGQEHQITIEEYDDAHGIKHEQHLKTFTVIAAREISQALAESCMYLDGIYALQTKDGRWYGREANVC